MKQIKENGKRAGQMDLNLKNKRSVEDFLEKGEINGEIRRK